MQALYFFMCLRHLPREVIYALLVFGCQAVVVGSPIVLQRFQFGHGIIFSPQSTIGFFFVPFHIGQGRHLGGLRLMQQTLVFLHLVGQHALLVLGLQHLPLD